MNLKNFLNETLDTILSSATWLEPAKKLQESDFPWPCMSYTRKGVTKLIFLTTPKSSYLSHADKQIIFALGYHVNISQLDDIE